LKAGVAAGNRPIHPDRILRRGASLRRSPFVAPAPARIAAIQCFFAAPISVRWRSSHRTAVTGPQCGRDRGLCRRYPTDSTEECAVPGSTQYSAHPINSLLPEYPRIPSRIQVRVADLPAARVCPRLLARSRAGPGRPRNCSAASGRSARPSLDRPLHRARTGFSRPDQLRGAAERLADACACADSACWRWATRKCLGQQCRAVVEAGVRTCAQWSAQLPPVA
jgi:hypothetical protein